MTRQKLLPASEARNFDHHMPFLFFIRLRDAGSLPAKPNDACMQPFEDELRRILD
jgi:hypothetical protein